MGWFAVFVCGRKPVAAIHGLRHALGMENFKNSGISRGGLMYTGGVRKAKTGIPVQYNTGVCPWQAGKHE